MSDRNINIAAGILRDQDQAMSKRITSSTHILCFVRVGKKARKDILLMPLSAKMWEYIRA